GGGEIAAVAAHDLHHRNPVVGAAGVAQPVDGFHRHVQGGIKADGELGAGNVVVDGAGNADAGKAHFGQAHGAHVGAVAANHHQGVDAVLLQVFDRFLAH